MNYFFSEQELMIKEMFSEFVDRSIIPVRKELDEKDEFPIDIFKEMGKQDFFRIIIPVDVNL